MPNTAHGAQAMSAASGTGRFDRKLCPGQVLAPDEYAEQRSPPSTIVAGMLLSVEAPEIGVRTFRVE